MSVLLVLCEHARGYTAETQARYAEAQERLGAVLGTELETVRYEELEAPDADALVLSGSYDPWALHRATSLERFYAELRRYPGPVLGICAGMQMLVRAQGGVVEPAARPVRGFERVDVVDDAGLLEGLGACFDVLQDHSDEITTLPPSFRVLATSAGGAVEAVADVERPWWGTQFHPERWTDEHPAGRTIIARFGQLAGL